MAIPFAKILTSEEQKKASEVVDWEWDLDSHDLVKDLEQKLKVAISEEHRRNEAYLKEQIYESEKRKEERRSQNKVKFDLDKTQEELVKARKRNIAKKYYASVKNQWNLLVKKG